MKANSEDIDGTGLADMKSVGRRRTLLELSNNRKSFTSDLSDFGNRTLLGYLFYFCISNHLKRGVSPLNFQKETSVFLYYV